MHPTTCHHVCRAHRIICFSSQNALWTLPWSRWSCYVYCHTVSEASVQLDEQKGSPSDKVTEGRKKYRPSCPSVLNHFDKHYTKELGDLWASARAVLLDPQSWQYGVLLNRFSAVSDVTQILQLQGFSSLLQTDDSRVPSDTPSTGSRSNDEAQNESLLHHNNSMCPPEGNTSNALRQDCQSEPLLSSLPPSLKCYIHSYPRRFPSQSHRPGLLKQYYLLNAASLLPVLALQVRDGEKVLDLCSAPGGKAVAIMQCANPGFLCCNEPDPHRREWLRKTLMSYLPHSLNTRVIVSGQDGRCFGQHEADTYDKVLVDAPCSNDRSWLYSSSNQLGEQRLKERSRLSALQAQLLKSALSAVRPGGVVVYSTCTLSRSENYAVVDTVLNDCPEAEPEDLWEEIALPFSKYFTFSPAPPDHGQTLHKTALQPQNSTMSPYQHRLGILVVPQPGKSWGPMFLSRIRRKK